MMPELSDERRRVAEGGEQFRGMFPEAWGGEANGRWRLAQLQRKAQQAPMAAGGVIMLEHHAVMQDLRILEDLLQGENGAARDAVLVQNFYPGCRSA
jgi:hypothetical protein